MKFTLPDLGPADFRFSCEIEVRFRDLDALGHVNNAVYATYFEVARAGYVRALGLGGDGEVAVADRFPFIILDLYCRYLAPVRLDDRLAVHLRTSRIGTRSFVFDYLITAVGGGEPVAAGRSTQVYYDYAAEATGAVPDELRRQITGFEGCDLS